MRRAYDSLAVLAFGLSAWLAAPCHAAESPEPVRILFAGSSSTYMHNMPNQVAQWLQQHGGYEHVRAHLIGKSGTGVHVYLRPDFRVQYGLERNETILENIARESEVRLVDETAELLQRTAWKTWQDVQKRLAMAGVNSARSPGELGQENL